MGPIARVIVGGLLFVPAFALGVRIAPAETITLKNGIVARGKILRAEERGIRVEYAGAKIVYHRREEVADVQRENDPAMSEVEALRAKGETGRAAEALGRAIASQRAGWLAERYRFELMECRLAEGRFAEAVSIYLDALRANPETVRYARLPLAVFGAAENEAALSRLTEALRDQDAQTGPPAALVRALLGGILAAEGKTEEAQVYLDMLRASHDDFARRLGRLLSAEIALARDKAADAAASLEKDIGALPEELKPRAFHHLGAAYLKTGDARLAAVAFLRVPTIYTHESPALQSECLYQGALACEKAGLVAQAADLKRELAERFRFSYRGRAMAASAAPTPKASMDAMSKEPKLNAK